MDCNRERYIDRVKEGVFSGNYIEIAVLQVDLNEGREIKVRKVVRGSIDHVI